MITSQSSQRVPKMALTRFSAGSNIGNGSADDLLLDGQLLRGHRSPAAHLYTYAHGRRRPMADDLVSDPVCGMKIAPADAVTTIEHEGKTYYFCSQDCADSFSESPADYV